MPAQYPLPVFHFVVEWGGTRIGFSEATGLTQENQAIDYRDGSPSKVSLIKIPGLRKPGNLMLKRGIVKGGNDFLKWLSAAKPNTAERRDLVIILLNEKHKVKGAKLKGPGSSFLIT